MFHFAIFRTISDMVEWILVLSRPDSNIEIAKEGNIHNYVTVTGSEHEQHLTTIADTNLQAILQNHQDKFRKKKH